MSVTKVNEVKTIFVFFCSLTNNLLYQSGEFFYDGQLKPRIRSI